jgi:hypothetical protein
MTKLTPKAEAALDLMIMVLASFQGELMKLVPAMDATIDGLQEVKAGRVTDEMLERMGSD